MTISAIYSQFDPDLAVHLDEAFERMGMDPAAIGDRHIGSAKRSIGFMLNSEWHTLGMRQWMIQQATQLMTLNVSTFTLPTGGIDIFDAVLRRQNADTPIVRMSRAEYLELPNKTQTGRPDRYFTDRQSNAVTVQLWRTPENSTDQIIYYYFRQMSQAGELSNTLQMPPHVLEAFISGLSARLAQKFAYERYKDLLVAYRGADPNKIGGALKFALDEDRERADVSISISIGPRAGRR